MNEKLCAAVQSDSLVDVRILLEQGADPLAFTANGMNAIGLCASLGNVNTLAKLLEHSLGLENDRKEFLCPGGDGEWMDFSPDGMGDLEWDEEIDSDRVFSPDKEWLDLYSYYARTWESIGQVLDTANELRDVHCLDRTNQMAPIHYAAKFGHLSCLRLLLGDQFKCPVDIQTYAGQTALHLACEYQHPKIVQCLLQHGANVNTRTFKVEDTALLKAAKNGNNQVVQILLDHGAGINLCNAYDVSALLGAAFFGHHDTVQLLVARGANVNLKDRDGLSALTIAVHNEATETIRCLLGHGAKVIPTHNLVHKAVNLDNDEILRMLILAGEQVTRGKDSYGLTPIDKIIQKGNVEMLFFCYDYFRLDVATPTYDNCRREVLMALHCDSGRSFRRMLRFFLNLGRNLDENDLLLMGMKLRKYDQLRMLIQENMQVNTEWNEEVLEILKHDSFENYKLWVLLVAAGFKIHQLSCIRNRWTVDSVNASAVKQYLQGAFTNPLSLQDLTRIRIRNILRNCREKVPGDLDKTPFERLLGKCQLPPRLVTYLYEYSDLDGFTGSATLLSMS